MANGDASFPKIPTGSWWNLRELFKKKVPAAVTATYLASALSMAEKSAQSNLIGPFKKIGIIEEDGKPTDLAYDWRDDNKYADVCATLLAEYYPEEVRDLFHTPDLDTQKLTNWFMSHARCGEVTGKMYARFYLLLLKANPSGGESAIANKEPKAPKTTVSKRRKKVQPIAEVPAVTAQQAPEKIQSPHEIKATHLSSTPELHVNIQLHISPETSADQIDKIFESMAKHLKKLNE